MNNKKKHTHKTKQGTKRVNNELTQYTITHNIKKNT